MVERSVDSSYGSESLGGPLRSAAFRPIRILVLSMVLLGGVLIAGVAGLESLALKSRAEADEMLDNALPSTEGLSDTAEALGHLDASLDRAMNALAEHQRLDWREVHRARRETQQAFEDYRRLATSPEGDLLRKRVDDALASGDVVIAKLEALAQSGDVAAAEKLENDNWRTASDAIDTEVRNLLLFNVQSANVHTRALQKLWRYLSNLSLGLAFALLILGGTAVWFAASSVSRQIRYEQTRATELELFADRVAHDILSPLASTQMALRVLSRSSDPKTEATAVRALASLRRAGQVVDGLFKFATSGGMPRRGRRAAVPMVVTAVLADLAPEAQAAGISLDVEQPPTCEVACGQEILSIVLSNLVRNAIKFMGDASERRVTVTATADGQVARFQVVDTGPGLPAGFETQAFRAYARGHDDMPGLGLGLATVKRLVEAYGGQVGVRSEVDRGASFWFTLPRADRPASEEVIAAA